MGGRTSSMPHRQKWTIVLLGLPSLGLALAVTVVVTYTPILAKRFTSSTTAVGTVIAIEGLVALFLPVLTGTWSDHLRTRWGGRLPFLMAGVPVVAASLLVIIFADSLLMLILCALLFFTAYYLAYEPYRALYPDLVKDEAAARAQSFQAMWRGIGTGIALIGGSFLLAVNERLPFIMAAVLVVVSTAVFIWELLKRRGVPDQRHRQSESIRESFAGTFSLLKEKRQLRYFVIANALWELTLAALKSFILLYLTAGLGRSRSFAAVCISAVAVCMFLGAPFAGKFADRYGKVKVASIAALVFGIGITVPIFTTQIWVMAPILPIAALGGATVLTLPYAILMPMMPEDQHGKLTGLYSTSRGIGLMLGPLLTGAAVGLTRHWLPARGYSAMWLVCSLAMLLSLLPLHWLSAEGYNK